MYTLNLHLQLNLYKVTRKKDLGLEKKLIIKIFNNLIFKFNLPFAPPGKILPKRKITALSYSLTIFKINKF